MIRIPNPITDLIRYRNELREAIILPFEAAGCPEEGLDLETLGQTAAKLGHITSKGHFGAKARELSRTEDQSLDAVYANVKQRSEMYRILGWIAPVPDSRSKFIVTPLGYQMGQFTGSDFDRIRTPSGTLDELDLVRSALISTAFPHPHTNANPNQRNRPFHAVLAVAEAVGGHLTKEEMSMSALSLKNDRDPKEFKDKINLILDTRTGKRKFKDEWDAFCASEGANEQSIENYSKATRAFLLKAGLLEVATFKSLDAATQSVYKTQLGRRQSYPNVYLLTAEGRAVLTQAKSSVDIRWEDLKGQDVETQASFSLLVTAAQRNLSLTPADIAILKKGATFVQSHTGTQVPLQPGVFVMPSLQLIPYHHVSTEALRKAEELSGTLPAGSGLEASALWKVVSHEDDLGGITRVPVAGAWPPSKVERGLSSPASLVLQSGAVDSGACMRCKPAPCITYLDQELAVSEEYEGLPDFKAEDVCPTSAIKWGDDEFPTIDQSLCVHCQLCLVRCPVGAIYWADPGNLVINTSMPAYATEQSVSASEGVDLTREWQTQLETTVPTWQIGGDDITGQVSRFQEEIKKPRPANAMPNGLKNPQYYPLVRNLFRQFDLKARAGRAGDTQFRFDGIVIEPFVMPVEKKSPSEADRIPVDAARQAVENAALIESHLRLAVNPPSIVVGYLYPNDRSSVLHSLENQHASFGVTVGMYSTSVLLYLLLRHLEFRFHLTEDIQRLFRTTLGACDEAVLKDYWSNYMRLRMEAIILNGKSNTFEEIDPQFPRGGRTADYTVSDLVSMWQQEVSTLEELSPLLFPTK